MKGLLIVGYGGHARSVADVALASGVIELVFIEPSATHGEQFLGFDVVPSWPEKLREGWMAFAASGDSGRRRRQVEEIRSRGWQLAIVKAPTSTVGVGAQIAEGSFLAHHSHVGPMGVIGESCILNTGCVVDHDSRIGDYTHVSVNTTVAGGCRVGSRCFLGAGATVIDKRSICDDVTLGAGSVVVKSIAESGVYVGIPAVRVR